MIVFVCEYVIDLIKYINKYDEISVISWHLVKYYVYYHNHQHAITRKVENDYAKKCIKKSY